MKSSKFECEDGYEAEKLASMLSIQKDGTIWLTAVANIVRNEIVIQLKDKSSHSVLLRDKSEAEKLGILLTAVIDGNETIHGSHSSGKIVEIVLD